MTLEVRNEAELIDPEPEARWTTRRAARETDILQQVLRAFVERPAPAELEQIVAAFADGPSDGIREVLARLDQGDVIQVRDDLVDVAYLCSAFPTPFAVQLADGQERYACCAIDALGIAPLLGRRVRIRSRCHQCGEPLELGVDSAGANGAPRPRSERRSTSSGRKNTWGRGERHTPRLRESLEGSRGERGHDEPAHHGLLVRDLTVLSRGERVSFVPGDYLRRQERRRERGGPGGADREDGPDGSPRYHGR